MNVPRPFPAKGLQKLWVGPEGVVPPMLPRLGDLALLLSLKHGFPSESPGSLDPQTGESRISGAGTQGPSIYFKKS